MARVHMDYVWYCIPIVTATFRAVGLINVKCIYWAAEAWLDDGPSVSCPLASQPTSPGPMADARSHRRARDTAVTLLAVRDSQPQRTVVGAMPDKSPALC